LKDPTSSLGETSLLNRAFIGDMHNVFCRTILMSEMHILSLALLVCSISRALAFKPHILFIVIDDLGSHDLGMHGSGIQTPHCDDLAYQGVYLNNYYVLPSCSPTRSAIMSGRYPLHTGVHLYVVANSTLGLPLDEETLPQVLQKAGYTCHAVGKWHLGHSSYEQTPTFRGFQSFYGFYSGAADYFTHYRKGGYDMRFDKQERCGKRCSELRDERGNYSTHVFTREAIRVIQQYSQTDKEKPLFLYLAHQAVHDPDQVPNQYMKPYENRSDWSDMRKTYAGMLSAADESIRNVTNALKKHGMWNETLIVFTTDNGGPTEICSVQGSSNYPKRGGKCTVWEGGTTGDGFVSGGALKHLGIRGGVHLQSLFHCVDWLPTLAQITGATPNGKPLDGVDQLDSLRDVRISTRREIFVGYGISDSDPSNVSGDGYAQRWTGRAIRWKGYKLLQSNWHWGRGPSQNLTNAKYALFNLNEDPSETTDIAKANPMLAQILRKKLLLYADELVPIPSDNPRCPWHFTNTSPFAPTWIPWCEGAKQVVVYQ
jgi:arylsulfatase A-like enzyme